MNSMTNLTILPSCSVALKVNILVRAMPDHQQQGMRVIRRTAWRQREGNAEIAPGLLENIHREREQIHSRYSPLL